MKEFITAKGTNFSLSCDGEPFGHRLEAIYEGEIREYKLTLAIPEGEAFKRHVLGFEIPHRDICGFWSPSSGYKKHVSPDWSMRREHSRTAVWMPLACLYGYGGENRLTVALSDAAGDCAISAGVIEETAEIKIRIEFISGPLRPASTYSVRIRIDGRAVPFYDAVGDVKSWWEDLGMKPARAPEAARLPMYSTWYSFHQGVDPDGILRECRAAKELGMDSVILDDGWQTDDERRGYAFCGDWEVSKNKIPDMKGFTDALHALGMKLIVWFSVPFVGIHSAAYSRFEGKYLTEIKGLGTSVLDPRYREVREYLAGIYADRVKRYGWDGLKLDFIDEFRMRPDSPAFNERMDCATVEEAVERLLEDVTSSLRSINPDILIEFRQAYVGPVIARYGNMFRAADCPNDAISNRIATLNLRLTSGSAAVHSDMIMFNKADSPQAVSQQLLSVMFAVPQISVRLTDGIAPDQLRTLKAFLAFWRAHRSALLDGKLEVSGPEANFTSASASDRNERITVLYQPVAADLSPDRVSFVFNCTGSDGVLIRTDVPVTAKISDVFGDEVKAAELCPGVHELPVPRGGSVATEPAEPSKKER